MTQLGPPTTVVEPPFDDELFFEPTTGRRPFRGILAWRPDAVSLLSTLVFFQFVVPARYVVPGFGAAGTPANLLGVGLLCLWLFARFRGSTPAPRLSPARVIVGIYFFVILISYANGFARGMYPDETNSAGRLVLETFGLVGIAVFAADAMPSRERLNVLLQRVVYGAAFMGFTGDLEFVTKINIVRRIRIPGLVVNDQLVGTGVRGAGGYLRVAGTASHYIEFGVVLGMLLPLAIHFAIFAPTRGRRQFNWLLVGIMAVGVPFAVSRAAALALVVAMLVLMCCWTWRARVNALVLAAIGAVGMKAAKPGLLGTIKALFLHASHDNSIKGRTTDYGPAFQFIGERPLFGRGAGTFIPSRYRLLDNQMLSTTIESGFVGLTALILLFVGGAAVAHRVAKFSPDPETRHLAYALLAVFVAGFLTAFTFDAFSFPIYTITIFLMIGVACALWRLDRPVRAAYPRRPARRDI